MMSYNLDLTRTKGKRRYINLILGICFIAVGTFHITNYFLEESTHSQDFTSYVPFLLFGMGWMHVLLGIGYSFTSLLGKAYVSINQEQIAIKSKPFMKGQKVLWHQITAIKYEAGTLHITTTENRIVQIALTELQFDTIQEIKKAISTIAKSKTIRNNIAA